MKSKYPLVKIKNLVDSTKKWNPQKNPENIEFQYIDIASVSRETKSIESVNSIYAHESPSRARQLVKANDVLISTVRPNLNAVAHVNSTFDGATASTGFTVLRPNHKKLDSRYLFHWVKTSYFVEDMTQQSTGASYPAVSDSIVKSSLIPLPPLEEQKRIAAILDKADGVRRKRREAIALTEELARSLFLDMFGDPDEFPKVKLKTLASNTKNALSSGPFGSSLTSAHYVENGIMVLRGKNVTNGKLNLSDVKYISPEKAKSLSRSKLKVNDVVVVAVGSSGFAFTVPGEISGAIMSQNFNKISPDPLKVNSVFLTHMINSNFIQSQLLKNITDTVRTFLSLTKLKDIMIPLPPLEKQQKFADFVTQIESTQSVHNFSSEQSENLFNSLLQRAFRGDL